MPKKPESKRVEINRIKLKCPVCQHDKFWERKTLMNTKGMTFFKLDWANKEAQNYICDNCGHVLWFLDK